MVGTHALLNEAVQFADLGLVVVDEQHRFEVEQRAALLERGSGTTKPHLLVMTATPIPRTVAMTVFGDLDVTTLRELPQGRAGSARSWSTRPAPAACRPHLAASPKRSNRDARCAWSAHGSGKDRSSSPATICPPIWPNSIFRPEHPRRRAHRRRSWPRARWRGADRRLHGRMPTAEKAR